MCLYIQIHRFARICTFKHTGRASLDLPGPCPKPQVTRHLLNLIMEEQKKNPHYEARKAGAAGRENKGKMIPVRVTEQEHAQIKANAVLAGLSVSEYLRRLGAGHQVKARFEKEEKRNLQGIGTNLSQLAAYANKGFFNERPLLDILEQLKKVLQS